MIALEIDYFEDYERPWLVRRKDGEYEEHAHFTSEESAKDLQKKLNAKKYPNDKEGVEAINRILTPEEKAQLKKTPRYVNKPCALRR